MPPHFTQSFKVDVIAYIEVLYTAKPWIEGVTKKGRSYVFQQGFALFAP